MIGINLDEQMWFCGFVVLWCFGFMVLWCFGFVEFSRAGLFHRMSWLWCSGGDQAGQHVGDMPIIIDEFVAYFLGQVIDFVCYDELSNNFGCRSFGDIEVAYALLVGAKFVAFSYVGWDGDGCGSDLVAEAEVFLERWAFVGDFVYQTCSAGHQTAASGKFCAALR